MRFALNLAGGAAVLALGLSSAHAVTFADYVAPAPGAANISLSGTTLTASAPILFDYTFPSALAPLGFVDATLTLNATEAGAVGLGPASLARFNGWFSIDYSGSAVTVGGVTLSPGEVLLAGVFDDALFDALGSAGSVIDSLSGGGIVAYANNALLNFSQTSDQSFSINLTNISPAVSVNASGDLSNFSGVSEGAFASDDPSLTSDVPEPATWTLMALGFFSLGVAGYSRRRRRSAAQ